MKLVQACIIARKDSESNFHHFGCTIKLVHAYLSAEKVVLITVDYLRSSCRPV